MKIIVGLGNPGFSYRKTRHNLGFMVLDAFADARDFRFRRAAGRSSRAEGAIGREKTILVKPMTFMNLSGEAVSAAVRYYDCPLEDLLVICDDVNLDLGRMRLRRSGSDGGHNGLKSVIRHLHSQDFPRLRLGVGAPPEHMDMMAYVLSAFRRNEWPTVRETTDRAVQVVETWVYHGVDEAMNRFN